MARVKRSLNAQKKRRTTLERAAGYRGQRSRLYRKAKEQVTHSLVYAYADRRTRKGDFRRLWITRINAAARAQGITYNRLIQGLKAGRRRGRPQDPGRPCCQRRGRLHRPGADRQGRVAGGAGRGLIGAAGRRADVAQAVREMTNADGIPEAFSAFGGVLHRLLLREHGRPSGVPGMPEGCVGSCPGRSAPTVPGSSSRDHRPSARRSAAPRALPSPVGWRSSSTGCGGRHAFLERNTGFPPTWRRPTASKAWNSTTANSPSSARPPRRPGGGLRSPAVRPGRRLAGSPRSLVVLAQVAPRRRRHSDPVCRCRRR